MTVVSDTSTPRFFPATAWMRVEQVDRVSSLLLLRNRYGNLEVRLAYQVATTNSDSPSSSEHWGSTLSTNNGFVNGDRMSGSTFANHEWVRFGFQAASTSGVGRGEVTVTVATAC
jgi:hypothetical protein